MDHKRQVHFQIATALVVLIALYGAFFLVTSPREAMDATSRLLLAESLFGFVPLPLLAGVGAAVVARYNDPSLIQGYQAAPSERLALLLAFSTNTLEQTVLHAISLVAFCVVVPPQLLVFAPPQVTAFSLGRILFFVGYRRAPIQRLLGFVVGYYPAVAAILVSCAFTLLATLGVGYSS